MNGGTVYCPLNIIIGSDGGIGTWTQAGGTTTSAGFTVVGQDDYDGWTTSGQGTLNLNGGVFATPAIHTFTYANIPGIATTGVVNFNGGTLTALASDASFVGGDGTRAT